MIEKFYLLKFLVYIRRVIFKKILSKRENGYNMVFGIISLLIISVFGGGSLI